MSEPSLMELYKKEQAGKRELLAQNITNNLFLCEGSEDPRSQLAGRCGRVGKRAHLIGEDGANLGDWTHASVKHQVLKMLTKYNVFE